MTRVSKRDNESRKLELVAELETSGYQSLFRVAERMSGAVGEKRCGKYVSTSEWMKRSIKSNHEV